LTRANRTDRSLAGALCAALVLAAWLSAPPAAAQAPTPQRTKAPEGVRLYFISPKDGETVKSPLTVRFGLEGMGVAPAGVDQPATGHHHLIVDSDTPPLDRPVPTDANHIHFGKGQTETTIELAPGRHTLQLLLGDHAHMPHDPPVVSERITVTVE
jgi:hypothetical protein